MTKPDVFTLKSMMCWINCT